MKLSPILCVMLLLGGALTSTVDLLTSPANADALDRDLSNYHALLFGSGPSKPQLKNLKDSLKLGALAKFICTNGKDPARMTTKSYVTEFSSGPCSPVMFLAGIGGTKMHLEIECELFRANNPSEFQACGWANCKDSWFANSPKMEYKIWIPNVLSAVSILNPLGHSMKCFAALFQTKWETVNGKLKVKEMKGLTVSTVGDSSETWSNEGCGIDAITNLLPIGSVLQPESYRQFNLIKKDLISAGYVFGLTAQAMPYDWRLPMADNQAAKKMERIITDMNFISGKKVTIIAHSFGNLNTLNVLYNMSQEKKDKLINRYFALAPPYTGAVKIGYLALGGTPEYKFGPVGINFEMFKTSLGAYGGLFNLMPTSFFENKENEIWMKSIQNQIAREKGLQPPHALTEAQDITKKIFPSKTQVCFANDWEMGKSNKCETNFQLLKSIGSVNRENVTGSNLKEILRKYSFNSQAVEIFEATRRKELEELKNPGVETVIVYSNINASTGFFQYNSDPSIQAKKQGSGYVKLDHELMIPGDNSITTTSALSPGLKWAYEFDTKLPGAKPVVFAEICSIVNRKSAVFQSNFGLQSNEYQGVACECRRKGSEKGCDHLGLVSDEEVVAYLVNSLVDNKRPPAGVAKKFDTWTESAADYYLKGCALLH